MRRMFREKSVSCAVVSVVFVLSSVVAASATTIDRDAFHRPSHGLVGEPMLFFVENLAAPVDVFFSDGTNPTVAGTNVIADEDRGAVLVTVPAGAKTGNMKIVANGVDSALFFFRVDAGTFTGGTDVVSGTVKDGTGNGVGSAVLLLFGQSCSNGTELRDYAFSDP